MPNTTCWSCDAITQHEIIAPPSVQEKQDGYGRAYCAVFGAFRCVSCNAIAVGIQLEEAYKLPSEHVLKDWLAQSDDLIWRPSAGMTRTYEDVPPHIAEAATEAYECDKRQHFRASILLARSVVEATAKEVGITKGRLVDKIEKLYEGNWIREHVKNGADSVRAFGNDMAHGDFVQPVTEEESTLVVALMEEILAEVFQSRAKVAKAQAAVTARKQAAQLDP
ncbi:DUF4145 domain-containing protein [Gordonia malaquae]|uniref:DUF4145 domain-containing protein n=1 Tax=Gordonia malaquae TaxID=410332 RepID=UPI0030FF1A53